MSQENVEIVRGIYCRTLALDPDLMVALAVFAEPDALGPGFRPSR
jgi:hypothetical protein